MNDKSVKRFRAKRMYLEGKTPKQIANDLGIAVRTVGVWSSKDNWVKDRKKYLQEMEDIEIRLVSLRNAMIKKALETLDQKDISGVIQLEEILLRQGKDQKFDEGAFNKCPHFNDCSKKDNYLINERCNTAIINNPEDIIPLISHLKEKKQEHFICISLKTNNEVINCRTITVGLLDRGLTHPREAFADAITDRAKFVIFAHNHPSGNPNPSEEDFKSHKNLAKAGEILGISVLDYVIISKRGFMSFKRNKLI